MRERRQLRRSGFGRSQGWLLATALSLATLAPGLSQGDFSAETFASYGVAPLGVFTEGNDAFATQDATETSFFKRELIRGAKQSIEISGSYLGGELFLGVLQDIETLLAKYPRLQVHMIGTDALMGEEDRMAARTLQERYPDRFALIYFGTGFLQLCPELVTTENHVKVVIVDGKYAIVGGTSLEERLGRDEPAEDDGDGGLLDFLLQKGARDADVVLRGPEVGTLRAMYFELFRALEGQPMSYRADGSPTVAPGKAVQCRYFPLSPGELAEVLSVDNHSRLISGVRIKGMLCGPDEEIRNTITEEYIRLLDGATESVCIGNLYFNPVDPLLDALMRVVNRGVSLEVITNGINEASPKTVNLFIWIDRYNYLPVLLGRTFDLSESRLARQYQPLNASVFEYCEKRIIYHKKAMVVDGAVMVVGSYNFAKKSAYTDYELVVTIESPEVAAQMQATLEEDKQRSQEVPFEEAYKWYFDWSYRWLAGWGDFINGVM